MRASELIKLGPQLYVPRPQKVSESMKPDAKLWTSTAQKIGESYTSAWVEWCKHEMPDWVTNTGILYEVMPGAKILELNTDKDVLNIASQYGIKARDSMDLFMKMRWDMLAKDYDAIHHTPKSRFDNMFMMSWDVESTAWFNTSKLKQIGKVKIHEGQ